MISLKQIVNEIYSGKFPDSVDGFINQFNEKSKSYIKNLNIHDPGFSPKFHRYGNNLSVSSDVLDIDSVPRTHKSPTSKIKDYIPKVVDSFKKAGFEVAPGKDNDGNNLVISPYGKYKISINDYNKDRLTAQINIRDIKNKLDSNQQEVDMAVTTFIIKAIEVRKHLMSEKGWK